MLRLLILVLALVISTNTIKVPVALDDKNIERSAENKSEKNQKRSNYYISDDTTVDSYLIPPDPHKPHDVLLDSVVTPATYLLPPSPESQSSYFYPPTESGEQSDWYPIVQSAPVQNLNLLPLKYDSVPVLLSKKNETKNVESTRVGRVNLLDGQSIRKPSVSVRLQPPPVEGDNVSPGQPELQFDEINGPANNNAAYVDYKKVPNQEIFPKKFGLQQVGPTLALHLTPPRPQIGVSKTPTKLYPKKFFGGFRPVPIPIAQFAGDAIGVPTAKPMKILTPYPDPEIEFYPDSKDKKIYLYKHADQKQQLQDGEITQHELEAAEISEEAYAQPVPEQETSETNHRYPGRNVYSAPLRQTPPMVSHEDSKSAPAPDERTEFRMHGMNGPHSYQFGYDTGKGKNRQFRFEERDNDGQVRGHYGYMDNHGKLRVVNYSAHPELGFHADTPVEKE